MGRGSILHTSVVVLALHTIMNYMDEHHQAMAREQATSTCKNVSYSLFVKNIDDLGD
jgi:hypothetical protein